MPLQYVNPARRTRRRKRALPRSTKRMPLGLRKYWNAKKRAARGDVATPSMRRKRRKREMRIPPGWSARSPRSARAAYWGNTLGAAKNPRRRRKPTKRKTRKTMARRKLYGAAAAAHAKKYGRKRRRRGKRRGAARKRRHAGRRRGRRVGGSKRSRAARKAARTRAANKAMRRAAARKGARRRRHGGGIKVVRRRRRRHHTAALMLNPRRRRRRRKNPHRRHRGRRRLRHNPHRRHRRRRHRRNPRRGTQYSMRRARRAIRNRYKTPLGRAYMRRHRMRSNPGLVGGAMDVLKMALPAAVSLYGARFISKQLAPRLPGFNSIPAAAQGPVMAGIMVFGAHFLTSRVGFFKKWRTGAMLGTGINLIDSLLSAIAPANIKAMFGVGDIYDNGLSDYVTMGDYMSVGSPIDDDITLRDYIEVGAVQEELGVEEELGLEEELGSSLDRAYLGGTSSESMLRTIGQTSMMAAIPERSFTRDIRRAGSGYDKADVLYGGIFGGGF